MWCAPAPWVIRIDTLAVRAILTVHPSLGIRAILVGKAKWKPQKPIPHGEQGAGGTPILNVHS